jgi:hypothetical protein
MRENIIIGLIATVFTGAITISVVPLLSGPLNAIQQYPNSGDVILLVVLSMIAVVIGPLMIRR